VHGHTHIPAIWPGYLYALIDPCYRLHNDALDLGSRQFRIIRTDQGGQPRYDRGSHTGTLLVFIGRPRHGGMDLNPRSKNIHGPAAVIGERSNQVAIVSPLTGSHFNPGW